MSRSSDTTATVDQNTGCVFCGVFDTRLYEVYILYAYIIFLLNVWICNVWMNYGIWTDLIEEVINPVFAAMHKCKFVVLAG